MILLRGHMRCQLCAWLAATLATVLTLAVVWSPSAFAAEVKQKRFASAEEGVQALMAALKANDVKAMLAILGPDARPLIITSDPVADRQERERVVREYEEAHSLAMSGETKAVLQVGKDDWPMPIPLVKEDAGWRFDTPAGKEEILNRRIGRNELAAIEVCRAYVDAQREYYLRNPGRDALHQYAQKFLSTKGKQRRPILGHQGRRGAESIRSAHRPCTGQGVCQSQGRPGQTFALLRLLLPYPQVTRGRCTGRRL